MVDFLSTTPAAAYPVLYPPAMPELQVELHICFGCGSCIFNETINAFNCAHSECKLTFSSFSLLSWTTGLTTAMLPQETFAPLHTGHYFYLQEQRKSQFPPHIRRASSALISTSVQGTQRYILIRGDQGSG